jgi:hypothetical protein
MYGLYAFVTRTRTNLLSLNRPINTLHISEPSYEMLFQKFVDELDLINEPDWILLAESRKKLINQYSYHIAGRDDMVKPVVVDLSAEEMLLGHY